MAVKAKRKTGSKRKKTNTYTRLQRAASSHCKNGTAASRKRLTSAIKAYKAKASKSGKSAAQIKATISRVTSCKKK